MVYKREVARRVFAMELKESTKFERDVSVDPKAPGFLITNLGYRVNRCLLVGTLVEVNDIGTEAPWYKAWVSDPTGVISVYAGQFQPEAANALAGMEPPIRVAVIGKTALYLPDNGGVPDVSIKAEIVVPVDAETLRTWVYEAAHDLLTRTTDPVYRKAAADALRTVL